MPGKLGFINGLCCCQHLEEVGLIWLTALWILGIQIFQDSMVGLQVSVTAWYHDCPKQCAFPVVYLFGRSNGLYQRTLETHTVGTDRAIFSWDKLLPYVAYIYHDRTNSYLHSFNGRVMYASLAKEFSACVLYRQPNVTLEGSVMIKWDSPSDVGSPMQSKVWIHFWFRSCFHYDS